MGDEGEGYERSRGKRAEVSEWKGGLGGGPHVAIYIYIYVYVYIYIYMYMYMYMYMCETATDSPVPGCYKHAPGPALASPGREPWSALYGYH